MILSIENVLKSDRETTVLLKDIVVNKCVDYGYVFVLLYMMKELRTCTVSTCAAQSASKHTY